MTIFAHPIAGEPLDVTTLLRIALSAPEPPRPPDDAVPVRASYFPQWSRGAPPTATWCDDLPRPPAIVTPPTEIDWSDEAIELVERRMADAERARRKLHPSRQPFPRC